MAPTKIKFVVSFSSQDNIHKVSNLLTDDSKRWLSDPQDRSGQVEAIFQLEQPCQLAFIDIGVIWCANIEVRVGRSDWPQGQSYVPLVPLLTLMSPIDCRLGRNTVRTCMFSKAQFREAGQQGKWDRIQVVCRQPWRKDVQIGLSFLRIRSSDSSTSAKERCPAPEYNVGGKPAAKKSSVSDIQKHFFGDKSDETRNGNDNGLKQRLLKIASTAENGIEHPDALPRVARIMLKANQVCTSPGQPDHHDNASCLFSGSVEQQQAPGFPEEVTQFLGTLNIKKEDIDSLQVSDLRHKFEKLKWRKLTSEEKRNFYACCQDFIGLMFEDNAVTTASQPFSCPSNRDNNTKSSRKSKQEDDWGKKGLLGQTVSPKNSRDGGAGSSKHSSPERLKVTRPISKENDRYNGGFLKKDYQQSVSSSSVDGSKVCATPKSSKMPGLAVKSPVSGKVLGQNANINCTHNNPSSFHSSSSQLNQLTETSPRHKKSQKNTAFPSLSANKKERSPGERSHKSSSSGADSFPSSERPSSQQPDNVSKPSRMHSALLKSLNHFVDARVRTISSPTTFPSPSAVTTDSHSQSSKGRGGVAGSDSRSAALKRVRSPLSSLERSCSQAKRPSSSTSSASPCDSGTWLNSSRGPTNQGRGGGVMGGRNRHGNKTQTVRGFDDLDDLSSPEENQRSKGRGQRTRDGAKVNRRLELPPNSASSMVQDLTPDSSDTDLEDIDNPFFGELQIDEDTTFVECPLCLEMFPADTVNLHAAGCPGKSSGVSAPSQAGAFVQCPLCEDMFPEEIVSQHASQCSL